MRGKEEGPNYFFRCQKFTFSTKNGLAMYISYRNISGCAGTFVFGTDIAFWGAGQ